VENLDRITCFDKNGWECVAYQSKSSSCM